LLHVQIATDELREIRRGQKADSIVEHVEDVLVIDPPDRRPELLAIDRRHG
jgi:hypothetical protein